MTSVFTRVLDGELPGRFVAQDELCAALLTIAPLSPGHTLVVPRVEIDEWTDLEPELVAHLMTVAHRVGRALKEVFPQRRRVALAIAGLEVPHTHLHVFTIDTEADMHFERADPAPDPAELDRIAVDLRRVLAAPA